MKLTEEDKNQLEELKKLLDQSNMSLKDLKTEVVVDIMSFTGATNRLYKKVHSMQDVASGKNKEEIEFYNELVGLLIKYKVLESSFQLMPISLTLLNRCEKHCVIHINNIYDKTEPTTKDIKEESKCHQ